MVAFLRATSPAQPASKEGYNLRRGSKLLIIAVLKILIIAVLVDTLCLFSSVNDEVHNNAMVKVDILENDTFGEISGASSRKATCEKENQVKASKCLSSEKERMPMEFKMKFKKAQLQAGTVQDAELVANLKSSKAGLRVPDMEQSDEFDQDELKRQCDLVAEVESSKRTESPEDSTTRGQSAMWSCSWLVKLGFSAVVFGGVKIALTVHKSRSKNTRTRERERTASEARSKEVRDRPDGWLAYHMEQNRIKRKLHCTTTPLTSTHTSHNWLCAFSTTFAFMTSCVSTRMRLMRIDDENTARPARSPSTTPSRTAWQRRSAAMLLVGAVLLLVGIATSPHDGYTLIWSKVMTKENNILVLAENGDDSLLNECVGSTDSYLANHEKAARSSKDIATSTHGRTLTKIMSSYEWHGDEMEKARADSASSKSYNTGSIFVNACTASITSQCMPSTHQQASGNVSSLSKLMRYEEHDKGVEIHGDVILLNALCVTVILRILMSVLQSRIRSLRTTCQERLLLSALPSTLITKSKVIALVCLCLLLSLESGNETNTPPPRAAQHTGPCAHCTGAPSLAGSRSTPDHDDRSLSSRRATR